MVIKGILVLGPALELKRFSGSARALIGGLGLYNPGSVISPGFKLGSIPLDLENPLGRSPEKVRVIWFLILR